MGEKVVFTSLIWWCRLFVGRVRTHRLQEAGPSQTYKTTAVQM